MPEPELEPEVHQELAGADTGWDEPNERTASVDAAVVRVCRAMDACAESLDGIRREVRVDIESAAGSHLSFVVLPGVRWLYDGGSWVDPDGTVVGSTLLRPTIRAIARATRPDFDEALAAVVRDLEVAVAGCIAAREA